MDKMDKQGTEKLFNKLSPEQQKQVQDILSDKEKTREILNTPQAQALIKKLMGGN
ncbi:MAG: hypothetical protein IIT39_06940 [Clostridia bacterium]|nr:hypothetical protein [Clostridia bacterium]